jgi:hypothetical protein
MFAPQISDRAGRGALCSRIDQLSKDIMRHRPSGDCPDYEKFHRLVKLLDEARSQFSRLYGHKPNLKGAE